MTAHPLKLAREEHGLSQRELAALVGTYQSAISKFEQGHGILPVKLLSRISQTLGVPMPQLVAPGQLVRADPREELEAFAGPVAQCACQTGQNPCEAAAKWLQLDPTDPAVLAYVDELYEELVTHA